MTGVRLDMNGAPAEGAGEHSQQGSQDDHKEVRDGTSGEGQGLSDEDESRMNVDVNINGHAEFPGIHPLSAGQQAQQKQLQGPHALPGQVVCWERFLPLRTLKVLLVETDDSTRHVVSALLRNCSYEVTAVANGLEAWKILEDMNHIDLVLTEVDMPSLSGIGLLSKIMSHNTCNNIPVIMMSSNDSMGIVFTCLSKGATDFLVKPIRKNELKNLWQHVWRKCHSSSGSGSESGIRTQKSTKSKSVEGSKHDTPSNDDGDDNGSIGLNCRDGSDSGSGTQSSWSRREGEFDSLQSMSPCNELADPLESMCAQAIRIKADATGNARKLNNEHDDVAMCNMKGEAPRHMDLQLQGQSLMETTAGTKKDKPLNLDSKGEEDKQLERAKVDLNYEAPENEMLNDIAAPGSGTNNSTTPQVDSIGNEVAKHTSTNVSNVAVYDNKQAPSLELSLEQNRDTSDAGTSVPECNLLRHSGPSAFSRYTKSKITTQAPTGNVGSCSPVDNSSEVAKVDSTQNFISSSSGNPNARSNGSSNNNDMGSTTDNACTKPEALGEKSKPKSTVNFYQNSAFQPVNQGSVSSLRQPQSASQAGGDNGTNQQDIQVQHHHHHYHHHHHHVHNMQQQQQQQQLNYDELSSMNRVMKKIPHCAPPDAFITGIEGNAASYGSASGSNNGSGQNGSSGQNQSSTAIAAEGTNLMNENGHAGICRTVGGGRGVGNGSTSILDQSRLARREAALTKFQQKRKERCFDKKVRYQSRKRLAEQRPRVRGQFVRQAANEDKRKDKSKDGD